MIGLQQSLLDPTSERLAEMALWRRDPLEAFRRFVCTKQYVLGGDRPPAVDQNGEPRHLSARSRQVYVAMFSAFVRWLQVHKRSMFEVSMADLLCFLDQHTAAKKDAKKVSSVRSDYLRMLKRVFDHIEMSPNPARTLVFETLATPGAAGRNKPTSTIPEEQLSAFISALPNSIEPHQWKRRRDRAMQALMLGSGLTVDEVIRLRPADLDKPDHRGALPVTISREKVPRKRRGSARMPAVSVLRKDHTTFLWPELTPIVLAWINERYSLAIAGELLFPAGPVGGGDKAEGPVNAATVYRQAKKTYERANIVVARPGYRTLRNTFAVRELVRGTPREDVGALLGHHEKRAIEVYERAKAGFSNSSKSLPC